MGVNNRKQGPLDGVTICSFGFRVWDVLRRGIWGLGVQGKNRADSN